MSRPLGYTGAPMESSAYRSSHAANHAHPKSTQQQHHSSYQPPSQLANNNASISAAVSGHNPYQASEEAFLNLSSTLLQKHAAYNYPPSYILYHHLSDTDRHNFAQAYHSYLNREEVTTYAEVGERPIAQAVREVRQVFGPTMNGMGGDSSDGNNAPEPPSHASTYHDMRDDVDTCAEDRSAHAVAPRLFQPTANKSWAGHDAQQQQSVYIDHGYQQRQQQYENGRGGQSGGRWTVPATSTSRNSSKKSASNSSRRADDAKSLVSEGRYVNMNHQYDIDARPFGTSKAAKKETELTTRSRSAPDKKVGSSSRNSVGLRPTVSLEDSKAIWTKSQARQHLMDEMAHSQELLSRATNPKDRALYQNHMDRLRRELEDLTDANHTSPNSIRPSLSRYRSPLSPSASMDDCASITSAGKKALRQYVNVVAPGNLPENYQFEAKMGKDTFTATVPSGGVSQGQVFTSRVGGARILNISTGDAAVVFEDDDDDIATIATYERPLRKAYGKMDIPRGRWRDGLMDGLFEGPLHPLFWHSWFCPQIALSQIMARLRIVGPHKAKGFLLKSKLNLTATVLLTILFYFVNLMVVYVLFGRTYVLGMTPKTTLLLSFGFPVLLMDAAVVGLFYFLLIKTRKIIRQNYDIPEGKQCPGNEDTLVSIFCTSCTVSQMGRHTADFSTYRGHCCTQTGLPEHIAYDV